MAIHTELLTPRPTFAQRAFDLLVEAATLMSALPLPLALAQVSDAVETTRADLADPDDVELVGDVLAALARTDGAPAAWVERQAERLRGRIELAGEARVH